MVPVVAFWILAVAIVGASLLVVASRNVFHAALYLVLTLSSVAGVYLLLNADFLAVVQVLLYVGAIGVMLIFGIMFTRDVTTTNVSNRWWHLAILPAGLLFAVLMAAFGGADWGSKEPSTAPTAGPLGDALFTTYLLPLEVASVLLLSAIIGAIVIAKER